MGNDLKKKTWAEAAPERLKKKQAAEALQKKQAAEEAERERQQAAAALQKKIEKAVQKQIEDQLSPKCRAFRKSKPKTTAVCRLPRAVRGAVLQSLCNACKLACGGVGWRGCSDVCNPEC